MTPSSVVRGRELPRKTLHLSTAVVPVGLWYGVPQRAIAVLLVALLGIACAVEVARRRSSVVAAQFDASVGMLLRPHEHTRGITGATWLLAALALTVLTAPLPAAIAATWAGAVGDAAAAIAGSAWRRARGGEGKTAIGSAACLLATALGAWGLSGFSVANAALLGTIAAAVERPSLVLDDNLRVTFGVALAAVALLTI